MTAKIVTWEGGQRVVRDALPEELPSPPTWEEVQAQAAQIIHRHLDTVAKSFLYDNSLSFVSYQNSGNALWQAQALAFTTWRDAVWEQVYAYTPETAPADGTALIAALPAHDIPTELAP